MLKTIKRIDKKQCKKMSFSIGMMLKYIEIKNFDSNARLNIITEQQDDISEAVSTMLSQYNVEVFSFENKKQLEEKFSNL